METSGLFGRTGPRSTETRKSRQAKVKRTAAEKSVAEAVKLALAMQKAKT